MAGSCATFGFAFALSELQKCLPASGRVILGNRIMLLDAFYSYLKPSTGFLVDALQLCQLTVNNVIPRARIPDNPNIHQLNSVL
jgi:hypothetical protein